MMIFQRCITCWQHHKKLILSLLLFLLVFSILGLSFSDWFFQTDDWGNIYITAIKRWSDVKRFFINIEIANYPSNLAPPPQAFFSGLFRPMTFVYYYIQYLFWGINPYGYFLVTIAVHTLSTVLLFHIFSLFTSLNIAFLAAACFGFHASIGRWIGWVSAQSYQIELFVFLIIMLLLYHYLQTAQTRWHVIACLLFLSNLFLREQMVFLPIWLMVAYYLYITAQHPLYKRTQRICYALRFSIPFWLCSIAYLCTRAALFPLNSNTKTLTFEPTWHSFITRMSHRLHDFVTYVADFCNLSNLPNNHQTIKGGLILGIFTLLGWLFYCNTKKSLVLFSVWSMLLFSWPALLMHTQPRYIYQAIPFSLLLIITLITYYQGPRFSQSLQKILYFGVLFFIAFNAIADVRGINQWRLRGYVPTKAFTQLVQNPITHNRAIYFLYLPPANLSTGCAQAIWILRGDDSQPVYQSSPRFLIKGATYTELHKNYITFKMIPHGFNIFSTNPEKICFVTTDGKEYNEEQMLFSDAILASNPLFVTWDYEKQQFIILDQPSIK